MTIVAQIAALQKMSAAQLKEIDACDLKEALCLFDPIWEELYPREKIRIMQVLIARIDYHGREGKLGITIQEAGIKTLVKEL